MIDILFLRGPSFNIMSLRESLFSLNEVHEEKSKENMDNWMNHYYIVYLKNIYNITGTRIILQYQTLKISTL